MKKIILAALAVLLCLTAPVRASNETAVSSHSEHGMASMHGMYGSYPMTREASGTSWVPDSSPLEGMHEMGDPWTTMAHANVNAIYDRQGGPRGDTKTFASSMFMAMAQRPAAGGTLGLRGMFSLDPLMGKSGYPELLQTGETADGQHGLIDRQHPHDLFVELAASYSRPLSSDSALFGYVGLPGEPALGPPTFMHRFSGMDNPEAPIAHHWLDSTHISYGVATLGYVVDRWKLEASAFHGREPDQHRYDIETGALDSASARLSFNPTSAWAMQASYGRLHSPESLEPDIDVERSTASVIYNTEVQGKVWQTILAWGRNAPSEGVTTNAYLLESAFSIERAHTVFGRFEQVAKNELFREDDARTHDIFLVSKLSLGYVYDFPVEGHLRFGIGGLVSGYWLPKELESVYDRPRSYMIFARLKIE